LEQRSRAICGLFEAEMPVCNVCGVAVSLLLKRDHLPVGREFRQHMAERGLYRVSASMKQHKRRMRRARGSMNLAINSEAINRCVAFFDSHFFSFLLWPEAAPASGQSKLKSMIAARTAPALILLPLRSALIAPCPFCVAARSPSSFRSNPQLLQNDVRRVFRSLVLRHRKSQRGEINTGKQCFTLTEGNRCKR
jgi:hypothetical protein